MDISRPDCEVDGNLRCSRSARSGKLVFPKIPASSAVVDLYDAHDLPNAGLIYSYTIIHPAPKSGLPPFVLAYADFADEARVFGRLELPDGREPVIGMPVQLCAAIDAATGDIQTYRFVLAGELQ